MLRQKVKGAKKMVGQRGIFFTFMAFLLVGTLIVLNTSVEQAETRQETKLSEEAAFNEVKNTYNNIEQQLSELDALYGGTRSPFTEIEEGTYWFNILGELPLEDIESGEEAFNAMNLFKIFVEENFDEGIQIKVQPLPGEEDWSGEWSGGTIDTNYLLLPQCLKISGRNIVENGLEVASLTIEEGTVGDGCTTFYDCLDAIRAVHVNFPGVGDTDISWAACENITSNQNNPADGCYKRVETRPTGRIVYIEIGIDPDNPGCSLQADFNLFMEFNGPIEQFDIVSTSGNPGSGKNPFSDFNYSVKKTSFNFCAGTDENACLDECETNADCVTLYGGDACKLGILCNENEWMCNFTINTTCELTGDGCCPAGCTIATDSDCVGICTDGETQNCPNQIGACAGTQETCTGGAWPGCNAATYLANNGAYEDTTELTCTDGEDNDCDGDTDCDDIADCSANPACIITCPDGICDMGEQCAADCLPEPHCSDLVDNDTINGTDCADPACAGDLACDASLVAYYKFEEGGEGTTADSSGNGNTCTFINPPAWTSDCADGTCLDFDGIDDYLNCGQNPILNITGPITMTAWVKFDSVTATNWYTVLNKHKNDDTGLVYFLGYEHPGDGVIAGTTLYTNDPSDEVAQDDATFLPGAWYHIAGVYDGSSMKTYLNGFETKSDPSTGTIRSAEDGDLWVGRNFSYPEETMDGKIDEVRIYSRALDAGEINTIFSEYTPT